MTDPKRLIDPRSGAPAPLRKLLSAARTEFPDEARLDKLEARIGVLVGGVAAGAGSAVGGGTSPGAVAAGAGIPGLMKVSAAVAVALAVGGGALVENLAWMRPSAAESKPEVTARVRPASSSPAIDRPRDTSASRPTKPLALAPPPASTTYGGAAQPEPERSPEKTRLPSVAGAARPSAAFGNSGTPTSADAPPPEAHVDHPQETEIDLLQAAQAALQADPGAAVRLADRHAVLFPTGTLAQEREVIAIEALVKLHLLDEARDRAARFFRAYPNSAHRPRIESVLKNDSGDARLHNP
jgi:hypothetical protein